MNERYPIKVHDIVMEASSKEDQKFMRTMDKSDIHQVNGTLLQELYKSVLERKDVDFGDIPKSNGDIEKVKYYKTTVESLDTLTELYRKNNIDEPAINTVKQAISNLKAFKNQFAMGFKANHQLVMMVYNTTVMAVIDATSNLIATYTNFIVSADPTYTINNSHDKFRGCVSVDSLVKFNQSCENGQLAKALNFSIDEKKNAFLGAETVVTGVVIMTLLSIVPITRELIYFFYRSRVKLSDYLETQATFLEMNKLATEASNASPQKRDKVIKKQEKTIQKLRKLADKIAINDVDTRDVVKKQQKDENALWSLDNIEKQITKNKVEDTGFNIV